MMGKFNVTLLNDLLPKVERVEINGVRHYVKEGSTVGPVPSVTAVVSSREKTVAGLKEWRKNVGNEEADRIANSSARRGTILHENIEKYLLGEEEVLLKNPLHLLMLNKLKKVADKRIDNIKLIEGRLFSEKYRIAGTVDLLADFDGVCSVIDWKNSRKEKQKEFVESYFIQETAYALMIEESLQIPVKQIVTIVSTIEQEIQIFVEDPKDWVKEFNKLRVYYHKRFGV